MSNKKFSLLVIFEVLFALGIGLNAYLVLGPTMVQNTLATNSSVQHANELVLISTASEVSLEPQHF